MEELYLKLLLKIIEMLALDPIFTKFVHYVKVIIIWTSQIAYFQRKYLLFIGSQ